MVRKKFSRWNHNNFVIPFRNPMHILVKLMKIGKWELVKRATPFEHFKMQQYTVHMSLEVKIILYSVYLGVCISNFSINFFLLNVFFWFCIDINFSAWMTSIYYLDYQMYCRFYSINTKTQKIFRSGTQKKVMSILNVFNNPTSGSNKI